MRQKRQTALLLALCLSLGLLAGCAQGEAPAPTPAPASPEPTAAATTAPTPGPTAEPAPEQTPESTAEPAPTEEPEDGPVFPETGYTTGDRELDLWLKEIIDSQWEEGLAQEELQQRLYLYVRDKFGYRKSKIYYKEDGDFVASAVANMKQYTNGNCYNFACMQYALFRAIGVRARVCVGRVSDDQPHCWVEVLHDGAVVICDAELEMQSIRFRKEFRNFYMEDPEALKDMHYYKQYSFPDFPDEAWPEESGVDP